MMRAIRPTAAVSIAAALTLLVSAPGASQQPTTYEGWYDALRNLEPDPGRGATVSSLMIMRQGATFFLESGQIQLLRKIDGRTVGAVWTGEGRFLMDAPSEVERAQLQRFYGVDRLDQPIRRAVFLFTGNEASLFPGLSWAPTTLEREARREVEEAMRYLSDGDQWIDRDLALPLINAVPDFFYAHVADGRGDPLMLMVTPLRPEDVSLSRRAEGARAREPVLAFRSNQDGGSGALEEEALDPIRIGHYDFAATIESNLDFDARATLSYEHLDEAIDWLPLTLYRELEVDSAVWEGGAHADFTRPEDSGELWIDFGAAPRSGTLTVYYGGDLLDREQGGWIEMKSSTAWIPSYGPGRPATYRLTFRHDEDLKIAAVGAKQSESPPDDDDMVTTVWQAPEVRWATFNVGNFTELTVGDSSVFELTVQVDERSHRNLSRDIHLLNDLRGWTCPSCRIVPRRQSDMAETVARDLTTSFSFFEDVYGPTGTKRFIASEIPYSHGEAHSGLVLLAWSTFQWTTPEGYDEIFRAHEVAHQWWGIGVRPATYHDRWLSEGFAQFSGLWYMGQARGSLPLMMAHLAATRDEIWERKDRAGPIWLGPLAGSSEDPGDYELTIYDKGAWVLHMIRRLLTDPDTGTDEAFEAMIKDFFTTYRGKAATTEQFMEIVEKHAGIPMGWFFDQWVYGTAIPEYHFSYKYDELPDNEVRMTVRVRQEGVPDGFQMIVPLYLGFGMAGSAQVNIPVTGPETEVDLGTLPLEPLEVSFNAYESVLAKVTTERWRD